MIFGQKRKKLSKNAQKVKFENFRPDFFVMSFFKRPKNRFLWQKSGKLIVAFGRNGPKRAFLAKKG